MCSLERICSSLNDGAERLPDRIVTRPHRLDERKRMRAILMRLLAATALIALIATALLGAINQLGLALTALAIAIAAISVIASVDRREMLRLLRTQRNSQNAAYERLRQILAATESAASKRPEKERSPSAPAVPLDSRSADFAALVQSAGPRTRALLVGGSAPLRPSGVPFDLVRMGGDDLSRVPHGLHTHVLIEPAVLAEASADDLRWLRRAFRWQHDTVIAIPERDRSDGLAALEKALGSPIATLPAGGLVSVAAPLGGGAAWGTA